MPRDPAARTAARGIAARRLANQQISLQEFSRPVELVAWMGAVQAQDYAAAKWAVALRLAGNPSEAAIERAVAEGAILRTHAMRGTWQFVTPADLHWIVSLVAPRLIRHYGTHPQLDLDERTMRRCLTVFEKTLGDGRHRTRKELATALERAGISPAGPRLMHLLARAELELLICSGARSGKQSTYALVEHRVPGPPRSRAHAESLAELARRYFASRGPATFADFVWWSSLRVGDARAALEAVQPELVSEVVAGQTYWSSAAPASAGAAPSAAGRSAKGYLVPAFDEYLVAYRDRDAVLDPQFTRRFNLGGGMLAPCAVVDGRVIATWRRTLARETVAIAFDPFAPPTRAAQKAIAVAARSYGAFLGLAAVPSWS